eukprot:87586-Amphidinium_carterae.1
MSLPVRSQLRAFPTMAGNSHTVARTVPTVASSETKVLERCLSWCLQHSVTISSVVDGPSSLRAITSVKRMAVLNELLCHLLQLSVLQRKSLYVNPGHEQGKSRNVEHKNIFGLGDSAVISFRLMSLAGCESFCRAVVQKAA